MAGLSNFISNSATQSTSMPTWYDQAQQNVVSQATTGAGNVPKLADTVAGGAINQLSSPTTNPFTQAQGTLNQIATGAANPWITGADGTVTPDTSTAMGGLFQAQNQQLNQIMPQYTAPVDASSIGSGNFGSLRGQTAYNKAIGDAQANLTTQQMQAALQNQQTGVQAGTGLGQVGSQGVTSMTNLGQAQQSDPLLAASALGKIVGGINTPTTTKNETQLSPLNQIGSVVSALGGSISGANKLIGELFPATGGSPTLPDGRPNPNYKPAGTLATVGSGVLSRLFGSSKVPTNPDGTPAVKYGEDTKTTDALSTGASPVDDEGNLNPGWYKNADGSYSYDEARLPTTPDPTTPDVPIEPDVPAPDVPAPDVSAPDVPEPD
jgi:hypothetical protein